MTEHESLLGEVLKGEGLHRRGGLDWCRCTYPLPRLASTWPCPARRGPGAALVEAVRSGAIAEEMIDDKVLRLLRLARQVGALNEPGGRIRAGRPDGRAGAPALLRRAAAASFVLLRNEDQALPRSGRDQDRGRARPNGCTRCPGRRSAAVIPGGLSTPAALGKALAGQAEVTVVAYGQTWEMVPEPLTRRPGSGLGRAGGPVEHRDGDGALLGSEHRLSTVFAWWGEDGLPPGTSESAPHGGHHVPGREHRAAHGRRAGGTAGLRRRDDRGRGAPVSPTRSRS
jgi:beta-glucosidase